MITVRFFSSIFGVTIGVFSLFCGFFFGESVKLELLKKITEIETNVILVGYHNIGSKTIKNQELYQKPYDEFKDIHHLSNEIPSIQSISTFILDQVTVQNKQQITHPFQLLGANGSIFNSLKLKLGEGTFFSDFHDQKRIRVCVIGQGVQNKLFPNTNPIGQTIMIYEIPYKINGVLKKKNAQFPISADDSIFIPFSNFKYLREVVKPNGLILEIKSKKEINSPLIQKIDEVLSKFRNNKNYTIKAPLLIIKRKKQLINLIEWFMTSLSLLILIISSLFVSNSLYILVKEQRSEIGLRKALGATNTHILFYYSKMGLIIFIVGSIIGLFFARFYIVQMTKTLKSLSIHLNTDVSYAPLMKTSTILIFTTLVSTLLPALSASKIDPSQALKED